MTDLTELQASETVKVAGTDANGKETNYIGASKNNEVFIRDTHDNGGLDKVITLTTTPVEGKVGVVRKLERKYVIIEALSKNIVWGFSNTSQSFDLFKSQLIMVPIGENTQIWFRTTVGAGQVAFGELS